MPFRLAVNAVARGRSRIVSMVKSPLGEPQLCELAVRIGRSSIHVQEPPSSLDELKAEFLKATREGTLARVSAQLWDRLPNALSHGDSPLLLDEPDIVRGLRRYLSERAAHRCLRNLRAYYFREFSSSYAPFKEVASILHRAVTTTRIMNPQWRVAQEKFSLFEPTLGPRAAARHYLSSRDSIDVALEEVGAPPGSLTSRFGLATLDAGLAIVSDTLTVTSATPAARGESLQQLAGWLQAVSSGGVLTLGIQSSVALKMLTPWENRKPSDSLRKFLVNLLLTFVGDPRQSGLAWKQPELQAAKDRLLNWLAYGTIERFFEVIDASAQEGHWSERRAFWASYADGGAITDAWVAYGPVALNLARNLSDPSFRFGQLTNARLRDHSALLLRIGTLVIADYSHNGSCRFYSGAAWQPEFYLSGYNDSQLRENAGDAFAHHVNWQCKFAQYIRRQTGIRSPYEGSV